jgi:hypothetical protein
VWHKTGEQTRETLCGLAQGVQLYAFNRRVTQKSLCQLNRVWIDVILDLGPQLELTYRRQPHFEDLREHLQIQQSEVRAQILL